MVLWIYILSEEVILNFDTVNMTFSCSAKVYQSSTAYDINSFWYALKFRPAQMSLIRNVIYNKVTRFHAEAIGTHVVGQ